ncbi:hypothetical protein SAMN05443574_1472 [Haloarcula vallismortis]|uniref:Uncharacterized protein n=1 Tax=Haloarcula vallismortis TaxID=28442 RepID=A0A1H3BDX8_HALVA|nr:hypothetical protein SAMN05443574_1472 [Haloarcula vallismortis]
MPEGRRIDPVRPWHVPQPVAATRQHLQTAGQYHETTA